MPLSHLIDAIGVQHKPVVGPARIVSLTPSITELLFALQLSDWVVGRTRYCIHPAAQVATTPDVGGTKQLKPGRLRELRPTHVIVNIDENPRELVDEIAAYVPTVIVTHPLGPADNPPLYRLLGGVFNREAEAEGLCRRFEQALWTLQDAACAWPRRQVLYLIWRKPWMTVSRDTYISRMLALVNWNTLPAEAEQRYPELTLDAALLNAADFILFSSEPYPFKPAHLTAFARQYHYPAERILFIDGEMTSWYGSRAITGLAYLQRFAGARMVDLAANPTVNPDFS